MIAPSASIAQRAPDVSTGDPPGPVPIRLDPEGYGFDVDLIVVDDASKGKSLRSGGRLADVAPTVLDLMGLPRPDEMTGKSLLQGT